MTYNASTNFGRFIAIGIAAPDGKSYESNVAGHGTEQVRDAWGYLAQLLTLLGIGENGDVLGEQSSKYKQEDAWDLEIRYTAVTIIIFENRIIRNLSYSRHWSQKA